MTAQPRVTQERCNGAGRRPVRLDVVNDVVRLGLERLLDTADTGQADDGWITIRIASEVVEQGEECARSDSLIINDLADSRKLKRTLDPPALGYLNLRDLTAERLKNTLDLIERGVLPIPEDLLRTLAEKTNGQVDQTFPSMATQSCRPSLTPRETQVLHLLVDGASNKMIARELSISMHGAKRLVSNILAKLNSPNRTLAVVIAIEEGLIPRR